MFPQVSTSFTLQEILMYASAYSQYTLGDNIGFPIDQTTDTLSGLGSIVIPQDLVSNVTQLHEFLFGTTDYTPSSTVQTINANIISTVNSAGTASSSDSDEEYSEARHIHLRLAPVCKALFEEGNPAGIKAALHAKGIIACGKLRDPLCSVSSALYEKLSSLVCRQH